MATSYQASQRFGSITAMRDALAAALPHLPPPPAEMPDLYIPPLVLDLEPAPAPIFGEEPARGGGAAFAIGLIAMGIATLILILSTTILVAALLIEDDKGVAHRSSPQPHIVYRSAAVVGPPGPNAGVPWGIEAVRVPPWGIEAPAMDLVEAVAEPWADPPPAPPSQTDRAPTVRSDPGPDPPVRLVGPPQTTIESPEPFDPPDRPKIDADPVVSLYASQPWDGDFDLGLLRRIFSGRHHQWADGSQVVVVLPIGDREVTSWIEDRTGLSLRSIRATLRESAFQGHVGYVEVDTVDGAIEVLGERPGGVTVMRSGAPFAPIQVRGLSR